MPQIGKISPSNQNGLDNTTFTLLLYFYKYFQERHSENSPGNWMWQHMNESVSWFDWADGQPNNFHGQNCITLRETHVPILPQFRDYFWNDYECDGSAHYICEHRCFDQNGNRSP